MKYKSYLTIATGLAALCGSCRSDKNDFDATGSFEAVEYMISSEVAGKVDALYLEEGQQIDSGIVVIRIDSTQLALKKRQLEAQLQALQKRRPDIPVQLSSLQQQLQTAEREQERMRKLVAGNAGTRKQLDDATAAVELIRRQINAQRSSLSGSYEGADADISALYAQLQQVEDQLARCTIINPVSGTVLGRYIEQYEIAAPGKALYKIADLSTLTLRAYVSGNQLPAIRLNQSVTVSTDDGKGGFTQEKGVITWISDKAEFTPKTVQTKDERADMVYAVKIRVVNKGNLKIGMYGQIKL